MNVEEFSRIFPLRSQELAWFLGAGASAGSGIPTAGQMIHDMKLDIYCSDNQMPRDTFKASDAGHVSRLVKQHFEDVYDWRNLVEDEYSAVFQLAYQSPDDRKRMIDGYVRKGRPSSGHFALAAVIAAGRTNWVWTTNFDDMVEKAAEKILHDDQRLTRVALNDASDALRVLNRAGRPALFKIHGDFQVGSLKNVSNELQKQNQQMSDALVQCCQRAGLCVIGYSGRDDSVMSTFKDAIQNGNSYPNGIFWFVRPNSDLHSNVREFLELARSAGIQTEVIEVPSFDELMNALFRSIGPLDQTILDRVHPHLEWRRELQLPPVGTQYPLIRLNAIRIASFPRTARLVETNANLNSREIREGIKASGADIIATRCKAGIIAYGNDNEIRAHFSQYGEVALGLHTIEPNSLRFESQEQALIYDALLAALSTACGMCSARLRAHRLLYVPFGSAVTNSTRPISGAIKQSQLTGVVPQTHVKWAEACELRISYTNHGLWLHLLPTIYFAYEELSAADRAAMIAFRKKRTDKRYNAMWNSLLQAWIEVISDNGSPSFERSLYGGSPPSGAAFEVCTVTVSSRRN